MKYLLTRCTPSTLSKYTISSTKHGTDLHPAAEKQVIVVACSHRLSHISVSISKRSHAYVYDFLSREDLHMWTCLHQSSPAAVDASKKG